MNYGIFENYEGVSDSALEKLGYSGTIKNYLTTVKTTRLVKGSAKAKENTDFFLSLLKNDTGKYDKNASYNPRGKDVVYKSIYGSDVKVGKLIESGADMFFELLDNSPYTQGLTNIMRYTLYKYTSLDYGVTEFTYDIVDRSDFEYI